MECPQWFLDITNPEITSIKSNVYESPVYINCCDNDILNNTEYYTCFKHIDLPSIILSDYCLKCVNSNLKELYEKNELKEQYSGVCILCFKSECLFNDPFIGVQFVKDNYRYIDTSKYNSYYITDYFSNVVNIEKPKVLIPVNKISTVFQNTYEKIDIDLLIHADINDSPILDLVSFTNKNPSLTEPFIGYFLINANPESKDFKRIAISIMNNEYRSIIMYIDEDLDTFTYNYQEYLLKENKKWYLEPEFLDLYNEVLYLLEEEYILDYVIYYIVSHNLTYDFSVL